MCFLPQLRACLLDPILPARPVSLSSSRIPASYVKHTDKLRLHHWLGGLCVACKHGIGKNLAQLVQLLEAQPVMKDRIS